jgi:hypothetical protein
MTQQLKGAGIHWLCACTGASGYHAQTVYVVMPDGKTALTVHDALVDFLHYAWEGLNGYCTGCSTQVKFGTEWVDHLLTEHKAAVSAAASVLPKPEDIKTAKDEVLGEFWGVLEVPTGEPIKATLGEPVKIGVEFTLDTKVEKAPAYMSKTPKPSSYKADLWGIEPSLKLATECADFYLLMLMSMTDFHRQEEAKDAFEFKLSYLLSQFRRYTDMAVGGELRHTKSRVSKKLSVPKPLRDALANSSLGTGSRSVAWSEWYYFRKRYGTMALRWAETAFKAFRGGGYGGPKWANIAFTLRRYEEGALSALSFVDTCWGLQHNGGIYFGKAWYTGNGLAGLLNANLQSDYAKLLVGATAPVGSFVQDAFNEGWNFESLKTGVKT